LKKLMKLSDFSAVIFDLDGLVLDTESTFCIANQQAAQRLGYDFPDAFWPSLSGLHGVDIEQKIRAHVDRPIDLEEFKYVARETWRQYVEIEGIKICYGFQALKDFIVENACPFALATNSPHAGALNCLGLANLENVFSVIVTRDDVEHGKPAPDIFIRAAERLGVDIKRCLVLEDSLAGILAATRAGAFAAFIPSRQPPDPEALALSHALFDNLAQVRDAFEQ
jgi:beta-phosphoglucomutase